MIVFALYACSQRPSRLLYMSSDSRRSEEEKKREKKRRKNGVCWDSRLFEKHLVAFEGERKREKKTREENE